MKKRYILFGYQIQNGEFCIVQQEGAAVEYIFDAYSNGDSLQQIATHMSSCGPPYRSSDNRWNKNIIARLLSCDIYCGTATYPAIITKELYFQVQQLRNEKSVSYSSVLQSFRDDMQCCCGERLYWYPKTHQWYCRHCGMWSNRIRPEELSQQLREKLFWICRHVLTGVSKKNTGQLPQYYIENNHEGIVTKQTFREAQAEIARRNSKSATNHRKRHRGRYNSKYALSERLVCGDCGSSYKRVTWSIHGRKQIVWRCVNRLEYGTKFCSNSPSIPETELHQAILKAVQNLAAKFTGEVADQLNGILHQIEVGESLTPQLQAQLEQNQQEFDHLLEMSLDFDENTPFLDDKLKRLSDKIKQLKTAITQSSVNSQTPSTPTNPITAKDLLITEYDDMLTARIIEKIIVKSRQDLEIIFIGGYTQQISLQ